MLKTIATCPAHILSLAEARGVDSAELEPLLRGNDRAWRWHTSSCKSLAVGHRETHEAKLHTLYDSTDIRTPLHRDFEDDPCESKAQEKTLWYLIVEIEFGRLTDIAQATMRQTARPVTAGTRIARAHMQTVRVCVFHIDNTAARTKCLKVRMRLRQMFADCVRYQVDFVGGDANAASYRWKSTQYVHTPTASSFNIMAARSAIAANRAMSPSGPTIAGDTERPKGIIGIQMVTSNTSNELLNLERVYSTGTEQEKNDAGYDCIVLVAYSWGHTRKDKQELWDFDDKPPQEKERILREREESRAAIVAETLARPGVGSCTWHIYVQQYAMMLTNRHVWLSETDGDWHRPLLAFIRHKDDKNRRTRSAKATARRQQRPWYRSPAIAESTSGAQGSNPDRPATAAQEEDRPNFDLGNPWDRSNQWWSSWSPWWPSGWQR